ncbi:MAG: WD40 repeat domain-containing protein [Gemmataceae bacterium]|nr:WD40 repeat domain-containing protein [Gemmataceae bacterium]
MRTLIRVLVFLLVPVGLPGAGGAQEPRTLKGHTGWVGAVAFAPDGKLATGGADGTVRLWDVTRGVELRKWPAHAGCACALAFSPDGSRLATGGYDHTIKLWDVTNPGMALTLQGHTGVVMAVAFAPDGKTLASGSIDGTIKLWHVASGKPVVTVQRHTSWVNSVCFTPDGKIVSAGSDNRIYVWTGKGQNWKVFAQMEVREGEVRCVAIARDGKSLAAGTRYGVVRVWDISKARPVAVFKGHPGDVWAVAFSPDGKRLVSGSGDWDQPGEVRLWDTTSWKRLATLKHSGEVLCTAFSPDSQFLAAGSWDRTIKVWDVTKLPAGK